LWGIWVYKINGVTKARISLLLVFKDGKIIRKIGDYFGKDEKEKLIKRAKKLLGEFI
jgi:hypothetical protein